MYVLALPRLDARHGWEKDKAFHAAAEKLDAALRQSPTRTTEGRSHNVVRL